MASRVHRTGPVPDGSLTSRGQHGLSVSPLELDDFLLLLHGNIPLFGTEKKGPDSYNFVGRNHR